MHFNKNHAEPSLVALRRIIRENPLGIFTTAIDSAEHPLLQSSHIPFVLDVGDESSETELGRLRGHLARMNPQSKAIMDEVAAAGSGGPYLEREVLILFTSSAHHYVTPKFYRETKPTTGKVVPTWNYSAVQVYGKARVYVDARAEETGAFLGQQIHDLSEHCERTIMGYTGEGDRPGPWKVTDAPERYTELLRKAIIGVEVEVTRMEGKFKMSQEMPDGDIDGVIAGFRGLGSEVGREMADVVEERKELKMKKKDL